MRITRSAPSSRVAHDSWHRESIFIDLLIFCGGCGARMDPVATDSLDTGGVSSYSSQTAIDSAGGTNSNAGGSSSTGAGNFGIAYCNGSFDGQNCGTFYREINGESADCVIRLDESPRSLNRTLLAIDCGLYPPLSSPESDAGTPDGYWIDYGSSPADLVLLGAACAAIRAPGDHSLLLINVCTTFS